MVRPGRAGQRAVGHARRGGDAIAGSPNINRNPQRPKVVRRRKGRLLRLIIDTLCDRVHPLPLCRDPEVARHQEPRERQPRPHLQEL